MAEKLDKKLLHTDADQALRLLDAAGFFPAPGETREDFLKRAERQFFDASEPKFVAEEKIFRDAEVIPAKIQQDGTDCTERLYGFRNARIPGYFLRYGGIFFGGCSMTDEETGDTVLVLRREFKKRPHWFLYNRAEILAHEQCHATRDVLKDEEYEELFAYGTSKLKYRQYLGGCFRTAGDTYVFFGGFVLLIFMEIAVFFGFLDNAWLKYFLLLALLLAVCLLIRNHRTWRRFKRAVENLRGIGIAAAEACLFRATSEEIRGIASKQGEDLRQYLRDLSQRELRWEIALKRFAIPRVR